MLQIDISVLPAGLCVTPCPNIIVRWCSHPDRRSPRVPKYREKTPKLIVPFHSIWPKHYIENHRNATKNLPNKMHIFPQTVYCWGSQCCLKCVRLGWDAVSASLVSSSSCLRSCLPTCLPSWLGCCVRFPGLVFLLSPVLSPNLSPVKDAVSASLVSSYSCLPTCLPSGLGCCSLVSGLVSQLVSGLGCCVRLPWSRLSLVSCLVFQLISGLGCCVPPPWSCLALVSGLVSQCVFLSKSLVSSFSCLWSCLPTCLRSGMLRPPPWSCLALVSGSGLGCCALLSPVLSPNKSPVWDAVSASLVCPCLPSWLGCCVHPLGLVLFLSPVLSPNLSPVWGAVSTLFSGLVSQQVSGLGCCVRLP